MKIMGTDNKFGRSGTPEELYTLYGLSVENIVNEAINILK
jgi:transketolase C-terminal domain/subunit